MAVKLAVGGDGSVDETGDNARTTEAALALSKVWGSVSARGLKSLAVVPAGPEVDARSVALDLAVLGNERNRRVTVLHAEECASGQGVRFGLDLGEQVAAGAFVVAIVRAVLDDPEAMPVIDAADAYVVVVRLGKTTFQATRDTVDQIGRARLLGCVAVRER